MTDLLSRLLGMKPEKRDAILYQMPGYLIQAGKSRELYPIIEDKNWYAAHRECDPTLRGYTASLDTALQELNKQKDNLADRLVVLYLSSTIHSVQTNIPAQVITEISRSGDIQQARYMAGQRTEPLERCQAFLNIASAQAARGDRFGAAETLESALQAARQIASIETRTDQLIGIAFKFIEMHSHDQAGKTLRDAGSLFPQIAAKKSLHIRLKVYVLIASYLLDNNPEVFLAGLSEAFRDISGLPDNRTKGQLLALLASWAEHIQSKELYAESTQALVRIFVEPEKPKIKSTRPSFLPALQFSLPQETEGGSTDTRLIVLQRTARSFDLSRDVKNLTALLEWDQAGDSQKHRQDGEALAAVIRAADRRNDQATLKNIAAKLSSRDDQGYDGLSYCPELIEALAEVGLVDAAIGLIAEHLVYDPDASTLRQALARGAGRRGEIGMIYRAAEPIKPKHPPQGIGDQLSRWKDAVGHAIEKKATSLMAAGYSERIDILLSGHERLSIHHPSLAEEFKERLLAESDEKSRAHIARQIDKDMGKEEPFVQGRFFTTALSTMHTLRTWTKNVGLLNAENDGLAGSEIDLLLLQKQYEQALQTAGQMKSASSRDTAFRDIAFALMDEGKTQDAFAVAQKMDDFAQRQQLIGTLTEKMGKRSSRHADTSQLPAQLQGISPEDELLYSEALPALVRSLLANQSIGDLLENVQKTNPGLLAGCLPPCAEVIAQNRDRKRAQKLFSFYLSSPVSILLVRNLAALAVAWAQIEPLSDLAANALQQAVDRYSKLDLTRFSSRLPVWDKSEAQESTLSNPLPQLALAARRLADEKTLETVRKLARDQAQDEAKIQVAVADYIRNGKGMNSEVYAHEIGYQLEKEYLISSSLYRGLALAELAFAVRAVPPEIYYRYNPREKRELLGDYILDKSANTFFRALLKAGKFIDKSASQEELDSALKEIDEGEYGPWEDALAEDAQSGLKRRSDSLLKEAQQLIAKPQGGGFTSQYSNETAKPPFLEKLIRLYAQHRAWKSMKEFAEAFKFTGSPFFPDLIALCMKELVLASQFKKVGKLAQLLPAHQHKPAVQIYLTVSSSTPNKYDEVARFVSENMDTQTIEAAGIAAVNMNDAAQQRKLADKLLRSSNLQSRKSFLLALEHFAPLGSALLGMPAWRECAYKIIQLDSCWTGIPSH